MAKYETSDKWNSAGNLLQMKHDENLLKNYASLKTTSNYIKCKIANNYQCQIINTSEVSMAFNNYMEKMASGITVKDEKLLKICQEIEKLHQTIRIEKNDGITAFNCTSESDISLEENIPQNEGKSVLLNEENLPELPSNSQKSSTNNNPTSDNFLTTCETSLPANKREIIPMEESEKSQTYEMEQINLSPQQRSTSDYQPCLKKSKKYQKIKDTLIKSDQSVRTERPYVCSKCQMAFKRNLHLKRHFLVTHTLHKNFKCDTCGKLFSRKDYLDKHVTGHQKKDLKIKLLQQGIVVRTKIFSKSNK